MIKNNRILLVDDDRNILDAYERVVKKHFEIHTADSVAEALALIKNEKPFAVVVADYKMPIMDGYKFLSIVKKLSGKTVRILLSGYGEILNPEDAAKSGFIFKFLDKPCPSDLLIETLTQAIDLYNS